MILTPTVTYSADGTQTIPTFTAGLNLPIGVAVDAAGKSCVTNENSNSVTTYNADNFGGSRRTVETEDHAVR